MGRKWIAAVTAALFLTAAPAFAYNFKTSTVGSSTTPTPDVIVGQTSRTWMICNRSTSAVPVLCWTYADDSVQPTSVPANAVEIPIAQCRGDATSNYDSAIGAFWACALSTGSSAATVDSVTR